MNPRNFPQAKLWARYLQGDPNQNLQLQMAVTLK